jgi:hypothetical protein
MGMTLRRQGDFLVPALGDYTLDIDLSLKKSFQDKANLFLSFIDAYKVPRPDGAQYRFKVSAGSMDTPPNISALR